MRVFPKCLKLRPRKDLMSRTALDMVDRKSSAEARGIGYRAPTPLYRAKVSNAAEGMKQHEDTIDRDPFLASIKEELLSVLEKKFKAHLPQKLVPPPAFALPAATVYTEHTPPKQAFTISSELHAGVFDPDCRRDIAVVVIGIIKQSPTYKKMSNAEQLDMLDAITLGSQLGEAVYNHLKNVKPNDKIVLKNFTHDKINSSKIIENFFLDLLARKPKKNSAIVGPNPNHSAAGSQRPKPPLPLNGQSTPVSPTASAGSTPADSREISTIGTSIPLVDNGLNSPSASQTAPNLPLTGAARELHFSYKVSPAKPASLPTANADAPVKKGWCCFC